MTSIDVITPSFNRPGPLLRTLAGLAAQTYREFAVLVVDDCSTQPVMEAIGEREFPFELKVLRTARNSGPAAARNLGVRASSADLIAFIDDDVVPDPELLKTHLTSLRVHGRSAVSIGPLRAPGDWKPTPWNRWEAQTIGVEYARMVRGDYPPTWRQFFTGNAMLRREAFLEVGGFDETFTRAEDIEFAYRLARRGAKFVFEPAAVGWHYAERTLASWRKIPVQYAEFDVTIDRLHPELQWQKLTTREESRLHLATRVASRTAGRLGAESKFASVAISVARTAHGASLHSISNRLLSLAFQLEYGRRRRELLRGRAFNAPSTAGD